MKIQYLTFECVSRCNMDCNFCFSYWRDGAKELNTKAAKKAIELLRKNGLEAINFTGGEPLLRSDIVELLKFSKDLGLSVILTTNGILLKDGLEALAQAVDFIGLPLDSVDSKIHNMMRKTGATKNHHALIVELLDVINDNYSDVGIKINTIVTKKNIDSILGIGDLLVGKVVSWKLSQFIPGAYGSLHEDEFIITEKDFLKIAQECKQKYENINIIDPVAHSQDSGCRIMSTNGHLLKPIHNELKDLSDIFTALSADQDKDFNQKVNTFYYNKTYPNLNK